MKNVVVIFGAGASFDSINREIVNTSVDWRPPLLNQLFSDTYLSKVEIYGYLKSLAAEFQSRTKNNNTNSIQLENFLSDKYQNLVNGNMTNIGADTFIKGLIDMLYYLQSLFRNCSKNYIKRTSNYHDLLNRLLDKLEVACFITFNYDTLLENTISETCGYKFNKLDDYINHPYTVIKMHGSDNWSYSLYKPGSMTKDSLAESKHTDILRNLEGLDLDTVHVNNAIYYGSGFFPCMVLPINAYNGVFKKKFVCPDSHVNEAKQRLRNAEIILIVGWSGKEDHFGELLRESCGENKPKIVIIDSGDGTEQSLNNIGEYMSIKNNQLIKSGFSQCLLDGDYLDKILFS